MSEEVPRTRIQLIAFVFSKFIKRLVLSVVNPKKAIEEIKDSPNLLPILVLPLILAGLTFLRYFILFYLKINIPEPLYNPQLEAFFNTMIWINIVQYAFYLLMGILIITVFFMLGKWLGGSGDWVQGVSAIGYAHTPNILIMLLLVVIIFSFIPTVPTGLVNTIGILSEDSVNKFATVSLNEYTGVDSNLTISLYAQYKIPLNATKGLNNNIIGKTTISRGNANISYSMKTVNGIRMFNTSVSLNNTIIDHDTPAILNDIVLNISDYCDGRYLEKLSLDLIVMLNNTYVSPIPKNSSIPYTANITFYYSDMIRTCEITSEFYPDIVQFPDPEPFLNVVRERTSVAEYILTTVATIWQISFLLMAFKTIHELTWRKAALIMIVYVVIKFFVIGFTI